MAGGGPGDGRAKTGPGQVGKDGGECFWGKTRVRQSKTEQYQVKVRVHTRPRQKQDMAGTTGRSGKLPKQVSIGQGRVRLKDNSMLFRMPCGSGSFIAPSPLRLSNIYENLVSCQCLFWGKRIWWFQGDLMTLQGASNSKKTLRGSSYEILGINH